MNILITGAKGFIGKNLCAQLNNIATNRARWYKVDPNITIMEYDIDSGFEQLEAYCKKRTLCLIWPELIDRKTLVSS